MTFLAFLALDLGRTLRHLWRLLPHLSFLNLVFSLPFAWISFDYYIAVLQWRSCHLHNIAKSESAVSLRKSSLPTSIETTSSSSAKLVTCFFVGDGSSPSPVLSFSLLGFVGFVPNFVVSSKMIWSFRSKKVAPKNIKNSQSYNGFFLTHNLDFPVVKISHNTTPFFKNDPYQLLPNTCPSEIS